MIRYIIITCFISSFIVFSFGGIFTKGKTRIDFEKAHDCKGEDTPKYPLYFKFDKCNKTHKCLGLNFTLAEPIGPSSILLVSARKFTNNGGWANNAFNIKMYDCCNSLGKLLGKNWNNIAKGMGITCPVKPGTYVLDKYYVDFRDLPIAFMVGRYEIKGKLMYNNIVMMCKTFVGKIENQ